MLQRIKLFFLLCSLAVLFCSQDCQAAELNGCPLTFIDSRGDTGYYIDSSSISYDTDTESTAVIAIIKVRTSRMFVYTAHFDAGAGTYQLLNSSIYDYDTKEELSTSDQYSPPRPYGAYSPMQEVVDYIYGQR